eukprot:4738402-Prymnesium_polylepis.1
MPSRRAAHTARTRASDSVHIVAPHAAARRRTAVGRRASAQWPARRRHASSRASRSPRAARSSRSPSRRLLRSRVSRRPWRRCSHTP